MLALVVVDSVLRLAIVVKRSSASWTDSAERSEALETEREQVHEEERVLTSCEGQPPHALLNRKSTSNSKSKTAILFVLLSQPRILTTLYGVSVAQTLITSFDVSSPSLFTGHLARAQPAQAYYSWPSPSLHLPLSRWNALR